jgi:predicted Abi (CAAX) family protease
VTTVLQLAVNLLAPLPHLASLLDRVRDALLTPLTGAAAGQTGLILGAYAPLALGVGRRSGFLLALWRWPPLGVLLRGSLPLLLMPALGEELLFRVALLPHPAGGPNFASFWAWGALNVGLFVVYHPLAARASCCSAPCLAVPACLPTGPAAPSGRRC